MAPRNPQYPGDHPEPPTDLNLRPLPLVSIQATWYRLHSADRPAGYFGRAGLHRFDDPDRSFGVLYLGDSPHCCFVETFGRSEHSTRIVTSHSLQQRALAHVEFQQPTRVVDLTGAGLAHISADSRLVTGSYEVAQRWSVSLWAHPEQPDGVLYRSRHDPARLCLARFERASSLIQVSSLGNLLAPEHTELLADILDTYALGYVELDA